MATTGLPPVNADEVVLAVHDSNNNKSINDPLNLQSACMDAAGATGTSCYYAYWTCDGWVGYLLTAQFESVSNLSLYTENASGMSGTILTGGTLVPDSVYDIGSCNDLDDAPAVFNS